MAHACVCFWVALEKEDDENHIRITLTSIQCSLFFYNPEDQEVYAGSSD